VTRTDRRLLSSVVHRMLATDLFSYKVLAEIHFNLIDFPGLNESYVAGTKSKVLMEAVKTHAFDRIISYYATINNASQLMNVNVLDIDVTATIIPVSDEDSSEGDILSDEQIAGLVIGVTLGAVLVIVLAYSVLVKSRLHSSEASSGGAISHPGISFDPVAETDITTVYEEGSDKILLGTTSTRQVELSGLARI
jgi:hypothetical protein